MKVTCFAELPSVGLVFSGARLLTKAGKRVFRAAEKNPQQEANATVPLYCGCGGLCNLVNHVSHCKYLWESPVALLTESQSKAQ